ncbi:two-component system connector SafA [Shigella flexneri]
MKCINHDKTKSRKEHIQIMYIIGVCCFLLTLTLIAIFSAIDGWAFQK